MRIYKTFWGAHIDLDHILWISDAQFVDRMGNGGYFVAFEIQFMLQDKPLRYEEHLGYSDKYFRTARDDKNGFSHWEILTVDNEWVKLDCKLNHKTFKCAADLQKKVNIIIQAWTNGTYVPYWNDKDAT